MDRDPSPESQLFRLWVATYSSGWRPEHWSDLPPRAIALEAVEANPCSADCAATFLEAFNTALLESERPIWGVAVPVRLRFEGDATPGANVEGHSFRAR